MTQLHKIALASQEHKLNIVFVHGLNGHYENTWRISNDDKTYWPRWLAEDFPQVCVYCYEYDAPLFVKGIGSRNLSIEELAGNLLEWLVIEYTSSSVPNYFICHSLGGLITKQLLRKVCDEHLPLEIRGICFLATPHRGSNLPDYSRALGHIYSLAATNSVRELGKNNPFTDSLHTWFTRAPEVAKLSVLAFYETSPTKGFSAVGKESADPGLQRVMPIAVEHTDHFTISRPSSRDSLLYQRIRREIASLISQIPRPSGDQDIEQQAQPVVPPQPSATTQTGDTAVRCILLTDIVSSSRLAETYPKQYHAALKRHNALIEEAVDRHGGSIYKYTGDGYIAFFDAADECLDCALDLAAGFGQFEPVSPEQPFQARIALHTGELKLLGSEYFGPALNRASRICQVCHPGQVLVSHAVVKECERLPGSALLDLGVHYLRDLDEPEHLYQLRDNRLPQQEFPPLPTLSSRPNNLLQQPNKFVGRGHELNELSAMLLGSHRLVTIIAPGGYGKSRLALQLCAELLPHFENGVFMIELAQFSEQSQITYEIANAIRFQFFGSRNPVEQITDYLRDKKILLCFDNFEHVLQHATLVSSILKAAPRVQIIATSRELLHISGEQAYPLMPLSVTAASDAGSAAGSSSLAHIEHGGIKVSEAAQLFIDRAMLACSSFKSGSSSHSLIESICAKLEGVPLALELAAAWMDNFTLSELLGELSQQLELTARQSDVPERHHSVRASLDWSFNLLTAEQRQMLMALSIFRGGCYTDAAAAVLGTQGIELRQALAMLADKSWLLSRPVEGQTRFFFRDMATQTYAYEKLSGMQSADHAGTQELLVYGDSDAATSPQESLIYEQALMAHARYFSALIQREGPRLKSHGQLEALRAIKLELFNLEADLDMLVRRIAYPSESRDSLISLLLPIVQWLWEYLDIVSDYSMMRERYDSLKRKTSPNEAQQPVYLWALIGCGWAHCCLCEYDIARQELHEAKLLAQALDDNLGLAASLGCLGDVERKQGNSGEALNLYTMSQAIHRSRNDRAGIALALRNMGSIELFVSNLNQARELYTESLAIQREIGDRFGMAHSLNNLGTVEYLQSDYHKARELYAESLAIQNEIGNRSGIAYSLNNLGGVEYMLGNYNAAQTLIMQSQELQHELGDRYGEARSLTSLGCVEHAWGNYGAAREFHRQALALSRELGDRSGEEISLHSLGIVEYMLGNYETTRELYEQALTLQRELGDRRGVGHSLQGLASLEYMQGNYEKARELCRQSLTLRRELSLKSMIVVSCVGAGCILAALGLLREAALALFGAQYCAANLCYQFDSDEKPMLETGLAQLDHAVAAGSMSIDEITALKMQAQALSLEELASFVLQTLADAQT